MLTSDTEIEELVMGLDKAIVDLESSSPNPLGARDSLLNITFDYLLKFKALDISTAAVGGESVWKRYYYVW